MPQIGGQYTQSISEQMIWLAELPVWELLAPRARCLQEKEALSSAALGIQCLRIAKATRP